MACTLGQSLLKKKYITEAQLNKALDRQRIQGGRLGHNLIALGFINEEQLASIFKRVPLAPKDLAETGLELDFIVDLPCP
jgi:hypothetical protein